MLVRLVQCAFQSLSRPTVPVSLSCLTSGRHNVRLRTIRGPARILSKVRSSCQSSRCVSTTGHTEDGILVYSGSLGTAVRGVKIFSYCTSGASLILIPQILLKTGLGVSSIALQVALGSIVGFFTFLTPILLHLITKGYIIRLYHYPDRDTYTAITYSVFLTEKRCVFHQSQVRIPAVSKMFTTFYAGHVGFLVNPDLFSFPHDYNHLMGYDKPFNFMKDDMDKLQKT
ncbi:transmembrane protein 70, mitochondrial [Girardinichthys multiradiatus]|uniref:transmembrane protein 70, mitochondrial n=1 Tax=Girardinichthys multiradiatus TaxID=208333 RepID=UPI001FAE1169|nr:transmembrane protein 70, mitochondrial [Girardinichthys multiradiatus]